MKKMSRKGTSLIKRLFISTLCMAMLSAFGLSANAFSSTDASYAGTGTSADPYRYNLPSNSESASWKSLVDLRYPFISSSNFGAERATPLVKVLEYHEGNTTSGQLIYSWRFDGNDIKSGLTPATTPGPIPYYETRKQPSPLGVTFVEDSTYAANIPSDFDAAHGMYIKCAITTDFTPDKAGLTVYAADHFSNGDKVSVFFYGGNTGTNMAGQSDPHDPYYVQRGVVVTGGYVSMTLTHGGDYVLMKEADFSALDAQITAASNLNASDYTSASYGLMQTALQNAQSIKNDPCTAQGTVDTATQALTQAINALVHVSQQTLTDSSTNTIVNGVFPAGSRISVQVVSNGLDTANQAIAGLSSNTGSYSTVFALDFSLTDSGNTEIEPDGTVQVTYPLPSELIGTTLAVFYIDDAGTATPIESQVTNGKIVFSVPHLSRYVIAQLSTAASVSSAASSSKSMSSNSNPLTGDSSQVVYPVIIILVLSVSALSFLLDSRRKRKSRN